MTAAGKSRPPDAEAARRDGLMAYQADRESRPAQQLGRQDGLKRRVFDTFDALLRFRGRPGLAPGAMLLDLGSADGALVRVAQEAGLEARGFDAADNIDLELDRLPLDDHSVDVITSVSVIEHLRDPAVMLSEAHRVLRPGGAIILVTPNWRYSMADFFDDPTHVHPYTPASLGRVLRIHGFEQVYVGPWIVKKPAWMWALSWRFFFARWCLMFRGDAPAWVPGVLKGKSRSLLAIAISPAAD